MARISFLFGIVAIGPCCCGAPALAFQPAATDHDQKVVESITLSWESERDLLVMLDEADDRIVLANAIVAASLGNAGLSGRQRYDGLRVAGSSLFHDKQFASAADAFEQAVLHTGMAHEKAEMTAAAAEAKAAMGHAHAGEALAGFVLAADLYLACDLSSLKPASVESVFRRLVTIAHDQEQYSTALTYANHAITLADAGPLASGDRGYFRYTAAFSADKAGDKTRAVRLYDDFVTAHPEYLNSQPILGLMVHARVRRELANGSSWDTPDQTLIDTVMGILRDPAYTLMPARCNYTEKLASSWDRRFATDAAAALRSELAKRTYPVLSQLDENDPNDVLLGELLWRELAVSQLNGAYSLYERMDEPDRALEFLARVTSPSAYASADLVQEAERLASVISGTP